MSRFGLSSFCCTLGDDILVLRSAILSQHPASSASASALCLVSLSLSDRIRQNTCSIVGGMSAAWLLSTCSCIGGQRSGQGQQGGQYAKAPSMLKVPQDYRFQVAAHFHSVSWTNPQTIFRSCNIFQGLMLIRSLRCDYVLIPTMPFP